MASQLLTGSLQAPGFAGLNLQESSVSLESGFALKANNAVIDRYGRIGARRGWVPLNDESTALGEDPIEFMFEVVTSADSRELISAGNNKLFVGREELVEKTVRDATNEDDLEYTITANNWQGAAIVFGEGADGIPHAYLAQANHPVLVYHPLPEEGSSNPHDHTGAYGFQKLSDVGSVPTGYTGADFTPNCVLGAYGRIWVADIANDQQTVYFSRLLDGSDFSGGDSGSLNLSTVFPNNDRIVGMAAHNGFLIIFGRNNIAIYGNPIDVTEITLAEFIPNVGCIGRDTIQNTGTDVIFLSDSGVRSLLRVIQEKSLPMRDISKNVRDDLMGNVQSELDTNIKSIYYARDAFYLVALPLTKYVYCFDMRSALPDGSARVTVWTQIKPRAFLVTQDQELLLGQDGYIGKYFGHTDNGASYRFQYYTNNFDLSLPTTEKLIKQISFIIIGGLSQDISIKWSYDYKQSFNSVAKRLDNGEISEYNISEYGIGEYTTGIILTKFKVQGSGRGSVVQLAIEAEINGNPFSVQKVDLYLKQGKTV